MGRWLAFLIGAGLTLTVLWSFAYPVVVSGATGFTSVWRGWRADVAPGWFVAEISLAFVLGVLASRIVPENEEHVD